MLGSPTKKKINPNNNNGVSSFSTSKGPIIFNKTAVGSHDSAAYKRFREEHGLSASKNKC